ncbi:hypothetical protein VA596_29150 [Amycolatopsis sp., V23-08]|uniref:Tetratricopeptide repeat protein n=1 Tax=Amycolatopsis heterodermiae TaxID=3110235 RepID=A0ABU5RBK8_9PSEU|nr:hypothetical protein [Amycolatopsis sp., V23-08]MEA5363632.1 hypothetical protein [Amycolatopsis sp., V23-08]
MSAPTADEQVLWDRLWSAQQLPRGRAHIAAVETVVRDADAHGSPALRYAARIFVTSAYQQGGEPAKAFVPFAWCLAVHDRGEADPHWDSNLYWYFKFMAGSMTRFPEMPLERTHAVLDDMERRYRLAGYSMNPVHQYRATLARHVGDRETAAEQYRLWSASPRGEMSDCVGCEPTAKVRHLTAMGRYAEAVEVAEPVLGGEFTCVEQPQDILTSLLLPYVHIGRFDDAARAHRQAYRAIRHDRAQLREVASHVEFCALTGNHARGLDLVERHLPWLDDAPTPYAEMEFAAVAALNLRLVAAAGHGDAPVGGTTVAALRDELTARALALVARFDTRNGTSAQGDRIRALLAAEPLVEHLPLSGPVAPVPVPVALPALPATAGELAELAEREFLLGRPAEAIWAEFDALCPEPTGELLALRLMAAADHDDPEAASRDLGRAAEAAEEAGNAVLAESARGIRLLVLARAGDETAGVALEASASRLAELGDTEAHSFALLRLATAHFIREDLDTTREVLDRAEGPVRASGSPALAALWLERRAVVLANHGDLPAAIDLAGESVARYTEAGSPERAARVRLLGARFRHGLGDLEAAFAATTGIDAGTDLLVRAQASRFRGNLAGRLGRPEDAVTAFRSAVADLTAAGLPVDAAVVRVDVAMAYLDLGRPEEAAEAVEDAEPVLERAGAERELTQGRFMLGRAYRELGRPEQAVTLFGTVAEYFTGAEDPAAAGEATETQADVLDELDRDAEAAAGYAQAAEYFKAAGLTTSELRTLRRAVLSWLWADDSGKALEALTAAETAAAVDDPDLAWERALTSYDGARLLANLNRPEDAYPRATAAATDLRTLGAELPALAADVLCGRLLRDLGKFAEARETLTTAATGLPEDSERQRAEIEGLLAELPE